MPIDAPGAPAAPVTPPAPQRTRVRGSLARRIAVVTTGVSMLTALIVGALLVPQIRSSAVAEAQQSLARAADSVSDSLARAQPAQRLPARTLLKLRNGEIEMYHVDDGASVPGILMGSDVATLQATGSVSAVAGPTGGRVLVEGRRLEDGSSLLFVEPVAVAAGSSGGDLTRLAVALAVGVFIAVIAGLVLARRLARPLKVAASAADQMARGSRDVQVVPQGPVEVAEVAESLNHLNAALSVSEARQREFLLSVSHELRTPLTSIRGYSEALADGVVPIEDVPQTASLLTAEANRLDRLVADLLDLARMGAREVRIDSVRVDVTPILAETAAVWSAMCAAENVRFSAELPSAPMLLDTDVVRLRQMLDNLLTNALRMTPPGCPIVLSARAEGGLAVMEVRDGGPGLTVDDLEVAFEPAELYSRYRGVRAVGSGVGLALVGRLAERLGGTARAGIAPEGGACFTIELPLAHPTEEGSGQADTATVAL